LPSVAERRLFGADLGDLLDGAIQRVAHIKAVRTARGIRPTPQRLADHRVIRVRRVFVAAESLLRSVIKAGDSLERVETAETQRNLIDKLHVAGEAETLALIVVVQKGHKELAGLAMGRDDVLFHPFPSFKHGGHVEGCSGKPLQHIRELEEQGIVERGVHPNHRARGRGVAPDELRDRILVVEDLAEGEEVLLPGAERELAHGIAEDPLEVGREELQGIDAVRVHIELGNDVLIRADQDIVDGLEAIFHDIGRGPLECVEVSEGVEPATEGIALPGELGVLAEFVGEDGCIERRVGWRIGPERVAVPLLVAPANGQDAIAPVDLAELLRCASLCDHIFKHISSVVENDVEDDIDPQRVRLVHQLAQLALGLVGARGETRLDGQEVLDTVAMIGGLVELGVL